MEKRSRARRSEWLIASSTKQEMADMREGQGGALGEECEDLALQSSVRGEVAKMVEYLVDGDLLVLLCGNCRGHFLLVFIHFIT